MRCMLTSFVMVTIACAVCRPGLGEEKETQTVSSATLETILRASERLTPERRELLDASADRMRQARGKGPINLLAVCTHNSRRSQFCQAWCALAVAHYRTPGVECFSCGTEATACNPRTLSALERSGWRVARPAAADQLNPKTTCTFDDLTQVVLWSKAFGEEGLPTQQIIALLCCDEADKACPTVPGAVARVPLHYVDPKRSDDSAEEASTYDERSQQIAAEMFYLIRQISTVSGDGSKE
jgi:arsenate reductase